MYRRLYRLAVFTLILALKGQEGTWWYGEFAFSSEISLNGAREDIEEETLFSLRIFAYDENVGRRPTEYRSVAGENYVVMDERVTSIRKGGLS